MKNRSAKDYTIRPGKEATIERNRHNMAEKQHSQANSFVKSEQAKSEKMAGKAPMLNGRYKEFDACMTNNGYHAQEFASKLTKGIDHEAFPVRDNPDKSQE